MSRQPTPDLMGVLMGAQPESNKAIKEESQQACDTASNIAVEVESNNAGDMVSHKAVEPASKPNEQSYSNKTIKQESNKASTTDEEPKEKATFNLSLDILQQLEDAWFKLKREVKGQRVTKTLIVERALLLALEDLRKNGNESDIFKSL